MKVLVGHTGFVGSNLMASTDFDVCVNSKNIAEAFGLNPDLLVYSGVRAEKFLANKEPQADFEIILNAIENIKKINPKKIVLISTIDVYPDPIGKDEDFIIDEATVEPYGKNRLHLEKWVEANIADHLIVRLPGLFGKNIKKNFIYDAIHIVPSMLSKELYDKFESHDFVSQNYTRQENGFYKLNTIGEAEKNILKQQFLDLGFTALNFSDSRGKFQFYNLENLWDDIEKALGHQLRKINLVTEPVAVDAIYQRVFQKAFVNEVSPKVPHYDCYSKHAALYSGQPNYIQNSATVLEEITTFIKTQIHCK
ncbi:NAD-dependent epimerase/dehydratase family protein [Flavobacterium enshiense]|uniref:NAD-dependent epimerase/dehydratase family protein n=1 Tax=Flavobacterium enshiense TaxID=1341165 RepID=UPI00345D8457